MARSRIIKPGFFSNEDLAQLPFEARLLFAGMWTIADRCGRLEDRPLRIRAAIFPYETVDVEALLAQLDRAGFIRRYVAEGKACIDIPKFNFHQTPHHREKGSGIPAFPESPGTAQGSASGTAQGSAPTEASTSPSVYGLRSTVSVPVLDQEQRADARAAYRVLERVAHEVLDRRDAREIPDNIVDLSEALKALAAERRISYDSTEVTKALTSAGLQRLRKQKPA